MRVLICPTAFSGTLTAVQAAEAMAHGWRTRAPHDDLTLAPLSAGGTGFLDVLTAALGGITVAVTVSDPLGRPVPAVVLMVDDGGVRTAYLEAAQACGLHLLSANERNPTRTTSLGVGQLIEVALSEGAERIVVGLGGSATNDAGAGLLAALGVGDPADLACGGLQLAGIGDSALTGLEQLRDRLRQVELVIATENPSPLLGFQGPSATSACTKGASPMQAQELEGALGRFTEVVARTLPAGKDLFTGLDRRLEREPGAGASGGLGYALYLLGAHRTSSVGLVSAAWKLEELLSRHDLVLTGQARLDWTALQTSVITAVAAAAAQHALPTVVLAGKIEVGRREIMAIGVASAYALVENSSAQAALAADPVGTVEARCARLAATWSPGR